MLYCCVLVSSDLPGDGVALGALHAAPLPASAHRLELLPALFGKDELQSGPGEFIQTDACVNSGQTA